MLVAVGTRKVLAIVTNVLEEACSCGDSLSRVHVVAGAELRVVQLEVLGMKQVSGDEAEPVYHVNGVPWSMAWCKLSNHQAVEEFLTVAEGLNMSFVSFHHLFPKSVVCGQRTTIAPCVILLLRKVNGGIGECRLTIEQQAADMVEMKVRETYSGDLSRFKLRIFHIFQQKSTFVSPQSCINCCA